MGFPMARNLARSGISVRAWNRSRDKAEPLAKDGAQVCDSPAEAAEGASVILTMLADADAVLDVVTGERGAFSALPPATGSGTVDGVIWLQMSTIGEAGTERCADLAGQHEIPFVDAPVLGTRQPAEQGKLVVLASGPATQRAPEPDLRARAAVEPRRGPRAPRERHRRHEVPRRPRGRAAAARHRPVQLVPRAARVTRTARLPKRRIAPRVAVRVVVHPSLKKEKKERPHFTLTRCRATHAQNATRATSETPRTTATAPGEDPHHADAASTRGRCS